MSTPTKTITVDAEELEIVQGILEEACELCKHPIVPSGLVSSGVSSSFLQKLSNLDFAVTQLVIFRAKHET